MTSDATDHTGSGTESEADAGPTILRHREALKRMQCSEAVARRIEDVFITVENLVTAVESEKPLTDHDGIGRETADVIEDWWDHRFEREEQIPAVPAEQEGTTALAIHMHRSWADAIGGDSNGA